MLHTRKNNKKYPFKKHVRNIAMMMLGVMVSTAGFSIFINPNGFLVGGVWGVSSLINHFFPIIPLYALLVILNIPLLAWGWSKLNLRFALYTVFCVLFQSAMLMFVPRYLPVYTGNPLLACLFGGLLMGIGGGAVVRFHGSGGGTEIIGIILKSRHDISVGTVSLFANAFIVLCAGFVYGFEPAMYTMVELFVSSNVFTQVLEGLNRKRNMMIVSENGQEIADKLMAAIGRGVTIMQGEGAFTHHKKDVLFCVVSRFELAAIKEIIQGVDPQAFVCINQTYEVMGRFSKKSELRENMALLAARGQDNRK